MTVVDQLPNEPACRPARSLEQADIFQVIFSFIDERQNYLPVMLVCKKWIVPKERPLALRAKWNKFACNYLNFSIDNQCAIKWAAW
jgi:hypothetical protein